MFQPIEVLLTAQATTPKAETLQDNLEKYKLGSTHTRVMLESMHLMLESKLPACLASFVQRKQRITVVSFNSTTSHKRTDKYTYTVHLKNNMGQCISNMERLTVYTFHSKT